VSGGSWLVIEYLYAEYVRLKASCWWSCLVRGLPRDESGSILSVVTVVLLRVSLMNKRCGLIGEEDWFLITSGVPKTEKGVVFGSMRDPPNKVLG
jgi:hypothetical protein